MGEVLMPSHVVHEDLEEVAVQMVLAQVQVGAVDVVVDLALLEEQPKYLLGVYQMMQMKTVSSLCLIDLDRLRML